MLKKWYNKQLRKWKKIKFSKKLVVFCIIFIGLYTCIQTYLSYNLGIELSPTLTTCVYAFFGTELAACAVIRIFDKESARDIVSKESKKGKNTDSVG